MYVRKTCKLCKKPTHMEIADDARCLYKFHKDREGHDHALRVVHLIFGEEQMKKIRDAG